MNLSIDEEKGTLQEQLKNIELQRTKLDESLKMNNALSNVIHEHLMATYGENLSPANFHECFSQFNGYCADSINAVIDLLQDERNRIGREHTRLSKLIRSTSLVNACFAD